MRLRVPIAVLWLGSAGICGAAVSACENEPPKTALGYTEDAKRAYDLAMEQYKSHNYIEATTLFQEVKRKYSYSKYARQAELRIADADYDQEKFADAIREYKEFVRAHRSDPDDVAYARSRIAEATYAEIPESFFAPATEERDQAAVVDAYKELKAYLADYPDAQPSAHVRELLEKVLARLVRHELYVARYYLAKDNYDAAIARVEYALHNYGPALQGILGTAGQPSDLEGEALILLGQTYLRMHKWPEARQAFESVVRGDPRSPLVAQAQSYLAYLKERGA